MRPVCTAGAGICRRRRFGAAGVHSPVAGVLVRPVWQACGWCAQPVPASAGAGVLVRPVWYSPVPAFQCGIAEGFAGWCAIWFQKSS